MDVPVVSVGCQVSPAASWVKKNRRGESGGSCNFSTDTTNFHRDSDTIRGDNGSSKVKFCP